MRQSITIALLTILAAAGCRKPDANKVDPVKWTVDPVTHPWRSASFDTVRLAATIDEGWYIYSLTQRPGGPTAMSVSLGPAPPFFIDAQIAGPAPIPVFDILFNMDTERYVDKPKFVVPVTIDTLSGPAPQALELSVRYQACNSTVCLPARTTMVSRPVKFAER